MATVSSALSSWKDLKAAYRFLSNSKVSEKAILKLHSSKTIERISKEETVLCLQDTTFINYVNRPMTSGLDFLKRSSNGSKNSERGLILHNQLAIDTSGRPLGLVNQTFVDRKNFRDNKSIKHLPVEEKESFRWVNDLKNTPNCKTTKIIHIADREADFFEFFHAAYTLDEKVIVRSNHNRVINESPDKKREKRKLFDHIKSQNSLGTIRVKIQVNTVGKKFRYADLEVKATKVNVPLSYDLKKRTDVNLEPIDLWIISATERKKAGIKPIEWFLLTNLESESFDSACEKILWYSMRWNIEVFHKILKSCCSIENDQLRNADALKKLITIKSIIAWSIFFMRKDCEINASKSCERVFPRSEWKILYKKIFPGKLLPKKNPTTGQIYIWIGMLGGFIGRKSDGFPGILNLARGWMAYMALLEAHAALMGKA
jgi:hypothetical protein